MDDMKLTTVSWLAVPVVLAYSESALPLEVENQTGGFLGGLRIGVPSMSHKFWNRRGWQQRSLISMS